MRRAFFPGIVALVTFAAVANASLSITITVTDGYGNIGGEYDAAHAGMPFTPIGLTSSNPFETFCIEKSESINFGSLYYAAVNTAAVLGGVGGGNPDPLDPKSAYLYQRFVTGTLADFVYDISDGGSQRAHSADDLQSVIWFIEEEEPISWVPLDGSRRDLLYRDALLNAGGTIGNVRVLNVYADEDGTIAAQDLIVLAPEPSSLALLALGCCGLLRRR